MSSRNSNEPKWGPHNPHPLSQMKTELVWDGKYDEYGNRRELDVAGMSMPLQKIETVDQPRSEAAAAGQLALFNKKNKRQDDFRNMLVWGDNKLIMASLLKQFKGKIDLIYIDPPFDVGADFTMKVPIGDNESKVLKEQSLLEMIAYRDTWGKHTDSYFQMLYERMVLMHELLTESGAIYVHCDWHVGHYIKVLLDDVFGKDNFRNQIVWHYPGREMHISNKFNAKHDLIFFYANSETTKIRMENVAIPYEKDQRLKTLRRKVYTDDDGREWVWETRGQASGQEPYKRYVDEIISQGKPLNDVWSDLQFLRGNHPERVAYATQKPEMLLERIINASTDEGDLVADFFCGSGTTGAVAERLGRRWIMSDLGRFAIHTGRKRLIDLQRKLHDNNEAYRAFDVYNLGRYERQWWQTENLKGADEEHRRVVLEFFRAEILTGDHLPSPLLHGRKGGAFCHVDDIDSLFTHNEAEALAKAVKQAGGKECYCLAWEFEMGMGEKRAELLASHGVKLRYVRIPREIMEKNRTEPPPFFELAALEVKPVIRKLGKKKTVDIKLSNFVPALAEVPSKELEALKERAIQHPFDFIDFWAVDFNWKPGKPFNHNWQDYRTRKDRSLKTVSDAGFEYPKAGKYTAMVKVVDVFGVDTSITVEVKL